MLKALGTISHFASRTEAGPQHLHPLLCMHAFGNVPLHVQFCFCLLPLTVCDIVAMSIVCSSFNFLKGCSCSPSPDPDIALAAVVLLGLLVADVDVDAAADVKVRVCSASSLGIVLLSNKHKMLKPRPSQTHRAY